MYFPLKSIVFLVTFWVTTTVNAQVMVEISDEKMEYYSLNSGDEFNSNFLDTVKWRKTYPWARHLYCSLDYNYYSDGEDIQLSGGKLHLTARKAPITARAIPYESDDYIIPCNTVKPSAKNLMHFDYQSGMIYSNDKFKHGYFEISFRADAGKGLWPAFWLFGGENEEIDIFEIGGTTTNSFHVDVHCKNGCKNYRYFMGLLRTNWGGYFKTNTNWSTEYHQAAARWTEDGVIWYLNGKPMAWWKGTINAPLSVIANLAISNIEGTFGGKVDASTRFPSEMEVDYIRVWQKNQQATLQFNQPLSAPFGTGNNTPLSFKKKIRPEYKRSKLKQPEQRIFFFAKNDKTLAIKCDSEDDNFVRIEITGYADNTIYLAAPVKPGIQDLSLDKLTPGKYTVRLIYGERKSSFSLQLQ